MEFLLLVFFCLQTGSDVTFGAENGAALKPYITIVDQTNDKAQLQCEVQRAFPKPELHWQDGAGNKLPAEKPKESERGGRYDIILQTTVNKTDNYRCVVTQKEINHQIYAETYVYIHGLIFKDRTDEIPGAAPRPYVRILHQTLSSVLLQCKVRGAFPKPDLEWHGGANILPAEEPKVSERGGRYDIILKTTVTKTDYYRCVATQKTIYHQTDAETYVYFSVGAIVFIVMAVIFAVPSVLLVWLVVARYIKSRTGSPSQSRQPRHQVPTHSGRRRQQAERDEELLEMNTRDEETPS